MRKRCCQEITPDVYEELESLHAYDLPGIEIFEAAAGADSYEAGEDLSGLKKYARRHGTVRHDPVGFTVEEEECWTLELEAVRDQLTELVAGLPIFIASLAEKKKETADKEEEADGEEEDGENLFIRVLDFLCRTIDPDGEITDNARKLGLDEKKGTDEAAAITVAFQDYLRVREEFVRRNRRLVIWTARAYCYVLPQLDLEQEGLIGLMKSVGRFDRNKRMRFSGYASYFIRQAMTRAVGNQNPRRIIRLPIHRVLQLGHIIRFRQSYAQQFGCEPALVDIAAEFRIKYKVLLDMIWGGTEWLTLYDAESGEMLEPSEDEPPVSARAILAGLTDPDDIYPPELIVDPDAVSPLDAATHWQLSERLDKVLETLSPKEALVIRRRFGLDGEEQTLEEVAVHLGFTRERIRQIEVKALRKLKHPSRERMVESFWKD